MAQTGLGPSKIVLAIWVVLAIQGELCIKWPVGTVIIVLASPGE